MPAQLKQFLTQFVALWNKLSLAKRVIAIVAVVGTLVLLAALRGRDTSDWTALYSGLTPQDAGELAAELTKENVPFRISNNGASIEVRSQDVHKVRMSTASAGLPKGGGVGFEIFDQQRFGTSSFVEQINYRRALQGELARSIAALDEVDQARVHIATGKRSVFRDSDEPPTASVALHLTRGRTLSKSQVDGIVHLISSSVDGLNADNVVVVDQRGTVLSKSDQNGETQNELEISLTKRVREMVERVTGPGRVAVVVTADMDQSKIDQTEEIYDKNNTALRSESRTAEGDTSSLASQAGQGGVAGVRGNLAGAPTSPAASAGNAAGRLQETRNFEVNRTVRHTVSPDIQIKRLHVAVIVDNVPGATPDAPTVPRTAKELEHISAIVKGAAGVDTTRGDVLEVRNIAFSMEAPELPAETPPVVPIWQQLPVLAAGGAGVFFLAFAVFMVLRARRKKKIAAQQKAPLSFPASISHIEAALDGKTADQPALAAAPTPVYDRVREAVKTDAKKASQVLSAWLSEETEPVNS